MLTAGANEALCVAAFTAVVWAAHAVLNVVSPPAKPEAARSPRRGVRPRDAAIALLAIVVAFFVGRLAAHSVWQTAARDVQFAAFRESDVAWVVGWQVPALITILLSAPAWISLLLPGNSVGAAAAFLIGGILGWFVGFPAILGVIYARTAHPILGIYEFSGQLWNATLGTALVLATGPFAFRVYRPRLASIAEPARVDPFLAPILMATAALFTATHGVFQMTLVFLPMCVACVAGIVIAESAMAISKQTPVPMSRVLAWGVRVSVECILGALIAMAFVVFWR